LIEDLATIIDGNQQFDLYIRFILGLYVCGGRVGLLVFGYSHCAQFKQISYNNNSRNEPNQNEGR